MPRVKLPPTPTSSVGPTPKDKSIHDMENTFVLPPAAMKPSPPTSPVITRKRTMSGGARVKEELPPPPSRARKIIQMKPKEDPPAPAYTPTTPTSASTPAKATTPHGKKKQPSATSAAGRRIARKTAHSIIERRRRSKMNEEFGVLKDMIPACSGVEMHKLAILQAGIEYVRYLQGCVEKLKDREQPPAAFHMRQATTIEDEDIEDEEEAMDMDHAGHNVADNQTPSVSPRPITVEYRRGSIATTATTSTHPSPALRPNMSSSSLASQRQLPPLVSSSKKTYSTSPPPLTSQTPTPIQTGVSPAFNAIHFSPDLGRTYSHGHPANLLGRPSPKMLPLPQAAMSIPHLQFGGVPIQIQGLNPGLGSQPGAGDVHAEATATAALMMMGSDRRGNAGKGGGMSVHDLLSH